MRPIALTLAAVLALAGCRHARPSTDDFARRVDAKRAELRIPGLSAAVVSDGRVVMARGFGTSSTDTLYPIGSITKTFTSTLMLQLGFPYGLGWFTQTVAGERVVWHTSWWPDAFSGLLVKVPARNLTLVLLANSDLLVSPQQGASNVLLYPIAADFLRTWLGPVGEPVVSDDDRLRLYGDRAAGERLIAAFPEDLGIQFDLAMLYGNVRPSLRINGPDAARALALFESIATSTREKPKWMNAWSHYLVAEHIAGKDPARARTFAERALATGVDTDGLKARIEKLLSGL